MKFPPQRNGAELVIRNRILEFSYFPMTHTTARWGIHSMLYAADPWAVIEGSLTDQIASGPVRQSARSFVRQAKEYFRAAERADTIETRPLLYYYCFLNLGKALGLARGRHQLIGRVQHGIAPIEATGHSVTTAEIKIHKSTPATVNAIDEIHVAVSGTQIADGDTPIRELIAQSVIGHRMWSAAANRKERFLGLSRVRFLHDSTAKTIWANLEVRKDLLEARAWGVKDVVIRGHLNPEFKAVAPTDPASDVRILEEVAPISYVARPSDKVTKVVEVAVPKLWQTVTSAQPHRNYYLYLSPPGERRYPQWVSIYAVMFWLGSLTRYQPVALLDLLDGPYGAFFREFLASQPTQFLYIIASEFKHQGVAKPAVV